MPKRNMGTTEEKIKYEGMLYRKTNRRAGYDIIAHEAINISPRKTTRIKTNVRFPDGIKNYFAIVTLRSSYQGSGLSMPSTGILDSDYTDFLFVTVTNDTYNHLKIKKDERFAQIVFVKNSDIELIYGEE